MRPLALITLLLLPALLLSAEKEKKPGTSTLTEKQVRDGYLLLFDGESTFGWKIDGEAKVEEGRLVLGGAKVTRAEFGTQFGEANVSAAFSTEGKVAMAVGGRQVALDRLGERSFAGPVDAGTVPIAFDVPAGSRVRLESAHLKLNTKAMTPLFNGKDLDGWKVFKGDAKREKSKWAVTNDGHLNVKDGGGDLQTEKKFDDFVLQLECISNGKHLNSGIFFRCLPGEYQQGYEAQIRNEFTEKPTQKYTIQEFDPESHKLAGKKEVMSTAVDYGTGAIYRRVPARKQVSKDGEWFTMTVVARGRHIATWVNGVQQVDWTDHRAEDKNARNGYCGNAGCISIQGHDPTTDLSFRNLRIAELPRAKK